MKLSIIMPVLNEAAQLPETLALPELRADGIEILGGIAEGDVLVQP